MLELVAAQRRSPSPSTADYRRAPACSGSVRSTMMAYARVPQPCLAQPYRYHRGPDWVYLQTAPLHLCPARSRRRHHKLAGGGCRNSYAPIPRRGLHRRGSAAGGSMEYVMQLVIQVTCAFLRSTPAPRRSRLRRIAQLHLKGQRNKCLIDIALHTVRRDLRTPRPQSRLKRDRLAVVDLLISTPAIQDFIWRATWVVIQ